MPTLSLSARPFRLLLPRIQVSPLETAYMSPEREHRESIVKLLWAVQEESIEEASSSLTEHAEEEIGGTIVRVSRAGSLKKSGEHDALARGKAAHRQTGCHKEAAKVAAAYATEAGATPEQAAEVAPSPFQPPNSNPPSSPDFDGGGADRSYRSWSHLQSGSTGWRCCSQSALESVRNYL